MCARQSIPQIRMCCHSGCSECSEKSVVPVVSITLTVREQLEFLYNCVVGIYDTLLKYTE